MTAEVQYYNHLSITPYFKPIIISETDNHSTCVLDPLLSFLDFPASPPSVSIVRIHTEKQW